MRHFSLTRWFIRFGMLMFWMLALIGAFFLIRVNWSATDRSITVLAWSVMFDHDRIREFERRTGIRVYLNHYESNEELLVKLRATQGQGFDLVAPSDYAVEKLVAEGLLKKLDRTQMPYFKLLNPRLLGHYFDPNNEYSVPYIWSIYCIAYNKQKLAIDNVVNYWDLLFLRYQDAPWFRVVMTNDPLEAIVFASIKLFGLPLASQLDRDNEMEVQRLLGRQKQWVEQYGNLRGDFALNTGSAHAVVMHSGEALRAVRAYSRIGFVVPRPSVVTIEHCAIPVGSTKDELVYKFLDFMFAPETFIAHFPKTFDFPARADLSESLALLSDEKAVFEIWSRRDFAYSFIRDLLPERARFDLWLSVKS